MLVTAQADDAPAAGLALIITTSGRIDLTVRGIEPEHADLVLERLDALAASLRSWSAQVNAPQLPLCDVLPMRS